MTDAQSFVIRMATTLDARAIADIYAPIVRETHLSAEFDAPDADEFARRIVETSRTHPWLVADAGGDVAGYAYATRFRARPAYQWSAEVSVYIRPDRMRRGFARALYAALLALLRLQGFRHAIAVIALPNPPSVALHERLGFAPVGVFPGVCRKFDRWYDIGWWRLRLSEDSGPPARVLLPGELVDSPAWNSALSLRGDGFVR